jgi:hypothetical protein
MIDRDHRRLRGGRDRQNAWSPRAGASRLTGRRTCGHQGRASSRSACGSSRLHHRRHDGGRVRLSSYRCWEVPNGLPDAFLSGVMGHQPPLHQSLTQIAPILAHVETVHEVVVAVHDEPCAE